MRCPGFTVSVPDDWRDVTDSLEREDCPFTLAVPNDGVGALQFSPAIYQGGQIPSPTIDDLNTMLTEFAEKQGFGHPIENDTFSDGLLGATASFRGDDDFIAVWYVSDGKNIMLVTYVCDWSSKDVEADARKAIVSSIRF
jgi:hypothetical protein